jgi:hypothetical protein
MKENTSLVENMVLVPTVGTTGASIQEIGAKIKLAESVYIPGWMAEDMKESGLITTWRAWEYTFGMMVGCIKDNIKTTKNTVSECTLGQMEDAMRAIGLEENNMVLDLMSFPRKAN